MGNTPTVQFFDEFKAQKFNMSKDEQLEYENASGLNHTIPVHCYEYDKFTICPHPLDKQLSALLDYQYKNSDHISLKRYYIKDKQISDSRNWVDMDTYFKGLKKH